LNKSAHLSPVAEPPIRLAMVFVCEKCGNRISGSDKNPSHRLASKIKKAAKRRYEKGGIRAVVTSCMNVCPDDRIAICIAPCNRDEKVAFYTVSAADLGQTADAIINAVAAVGISAPEA
jgi:predicted metal-binding protein